MLDLDAIAVVVATAVREATEPLLARIDALEKRDLLLPEKGDTGEKGEPGDPGADGKDGRDGIDGKDGAGLSDAFIDKDGHLVLTMTDGRTKTLCQVVGKDGEPGKDGADGITPEFMDAEFEGRILRLSFNAGGETKTVGFQLATPEYVGVYKEKQTYEPGDFVTWGGNLFHCDKQTEGKPDCGDWTLAVRRGRDGKDSK